MVMSLLLRMPILSDSFIASDQENFEIKLPFEVSFVSIITKLIPCSEDVLV